MKRHGSSVSSRACRAICVILALACLCITSSALTLSTATITGRVTDSNAAAIVGAKIEANNIDTNLVFSTVTSDEGYFVIPNIPPGRYRIFVRKDGFQTIVKPNVILHVHDIASLSFSMEPGSIIQSVTIEGGVPLIRKESATVGTVVDRQFVENLPLNGRSFQSLIALTPGVVVTKANVAEQGQLSVNGQRANANYFIVDGVSANIGVTRATGPGQATAGSLPGLSASGGTNNLVSVDALQEFKVLTSAFAAEFGRTPGAQISIVTRSGTNEFHGALFDYFRNDALDAKDWFTNSRGLKKPALRQNDFGGVFGGPVLLPRFGQGGGQPWYNGRNRTFFFFSYEGLRLRLPQTGITSVPSLNARQVAPASIRPFLNAFPIPNGQNLENNFAEFSSTFSTPSTLDAASIRMDHTVNKKLTLFARYNYAPSETDERGVGASLNTLTLSRHKTQTLTGSATLAITPAVSNDFRANYSRNKGAGADSVDEFGGAIALPDSIIFPSSVTSQNGLFFFQLDGFNRIIQGKRESNLQRQINLVDTLSAIAGAHQLKFGVDYRRLSPIVDPVQYTQEAFFNGVNGALTGRASLAIISAFTGPRFPVFTNLSLFGQDTWRITPRLTLTYGLRWEVNPPPKEKNGNDPFAITGLDNLATLALAPRGTPLYKTTYDNFAPRVGVAYQLAQIKGRETVLRGGFGVFYDLGNGSAAGGFGASFPNSAITAPSDVAFPLDPTTAAPPTVSLTPPYRRISGVMDPNLELPYTYQWNLAVEQSIGSSQALSISYIAALGRRLLRQERIRPNPSFTSIFVTRNAATSDYNALQLQFQRRLSRGLQALASYTWSHSLDNESDDTSIDPSIGSLDLRQERGPSDFDVRQAFNGAITYNIPVPDINAIGNSILHNWSIDTMFTTRSATPVNVATGTDVGFNMLRPDVVSNVPLYVDDSTVGGGRRINGAAFTIPVGRQGTLGRNALRGFSMWQVDVALRRQFSVTERLKLQLRAEAFNIFNHPNFGDSGADLNGTNVLTSPQFGRSVSILGKSLGGGGVLGGFNPLYQIGGPRSIQLALKLLF